MDYQGSSKNGMEGRGTIRVIGLTGGIATGKSSVARFLEGRGAAVIDADELAREAVRPGSRGLEEIVSSFGHGVLLPDGSLDRKAVGSIVFADPCRRKVLEQILHPEIRRLAEERIMEAAASGKKVVFYMAPLLIEAGADDRVDEIWVVTLTPQAQLERLTARDGLSRVEADRVVAAQMPLAEKERYARVVIDNSGSTADLERQLVHIWEKEIGDLQ